MRLVSLQNDIMTRLMETQQKIDYVQNQKDKFNQLFKRSSPRQKYERGSILKASFFDKQAIEAALQKRLAQKQAKREAERKEQEKRNEEQKA